MKLEDRKSALIAKAKPLYDLLLSRSVPVYVLGTNDAGTRVAKVLTEAGKEIVAFINDSGAVPEFRGRPVIKADGVPPDALVVSCSTAVNPVSAMRRLNDLGVSRVLDYFTLCLLGRGLFPAPKFCQENSADIEVHRSKYDWVESILADETSRNTFRHVVEFRYNFDLSAMAGFTNQLEAQYFESFVPLHPGEIFVDAGGFDGKTSEQFIGKCPGYRHIHCFEPDPQLMAAAQSRLRSFRNVTFHQVALSDHDGEVTFNQTGTGSGAVSDHGKLRVAARRLDGLLPEPPTFIKLDIEGAELAALGGAANLIRSHHPKLAVCVYHRQSDFWRIPQEVFSFHSGYKVYLRHYTEGVEETVMYFL